MKNNKKKTRKASELSTLLGRKLNDANDIWFDLHVGNLSMSDLGKQFEFPLLKNRAHITALKLGDIEKYRKELHKLLDMQFDKMVADYNRLIDFSA